MCISIDPVVYGCNRVRLYTGATGAVFSMTVYAHPADERLTSVHMPSFISYSTQQGSDLDVKSLFFSLLQLTRISIRDFGEAAAIVAITVGNVRRSPVIARFSIYSSAYKGRSATTLRRGTTSGSWNHLPCGATRKAAIYQISCIRTAVFRLFYRQTVDGVNTHTCEFQTVYEMKIYAHN